MRAFVFPGQGSQYVGMTDKIPDSSLKNSMFRLASDIVGYDIFAIGKEGPMEKLTSTDIAQPTIFTISTIYNVLLKEKGFLPEIVAGHSLGEYSALVATNALSFEDGLKLVMKRGLLMKEASEKKPGKMLAVIGLSAVSLNNVLDRASNYGTIVAANLNADSQVVLSGDIAAIEEAQKIAKEVGARISKILDVSGAFHSPLMEPVVKEMSGIIDAIELKNPEIPIVQNVTGDISYSTYEIKENLKKQITSPVRWFDSVIRMENMGVSHFVEVGPKNVLKGLVGKIVKNADIDVAEELLSA
jgi:[acyl-carrier-protein] S-malonyltransferase